MDHAVRFTVIFGDADRIPFYCIPFELGYLFYEGRKRNGTNSLRGVVLYTDSMPIWQYVALFVLIFVSAFVFLFLTSPVTRFLSERVFPWLPDFLQPDGDARYPQPARSIVLAVLILRLLVDGILNPIVEEVYFRGHLLPRISRFGWLSPWINASLFTLAHFWQPYNYPLILLIQLLAVNIVYWKRNIYIAMLTHCALNIIGAVLSLASFWNLS